VRPVGCPETSVQNYKSTLRSIPEECRSDLHHSGSLKSRTELSSNSVQAGNFVTNLNV
jgi:hypothetical protein